MSTTDETLPALPYGGTSGWSGSATSRERAETEDRDGTTSARQARVIDLLAGRGGTGMTVRELRYVTDWHHGQASGALSTLHKDGHIARLTVRRERCAVYVMPDHVGGRDAAAHGRNAADPDVVKREQYRVVTGQGIAIEASDGPGRAMRSTWLTRESADLVASVHGGRVQVRTVITTPWEDA